MSQVCFGGGDDLFFPAARLWQGKCLPAFSLMTDRPLGWEADAEDRAQVSGSY